MLPRIKPSKARLPWKIRDRPLVKITPSIPAVDRHIRRIRRRSDLIIEGRINEIQKIVKPGWKGFNKDKKILKLTRELEDIRKKTDHLLAPRKIQRNELIYRDSLTGLLSRTGFTHDVRKRLITNGAPKTILYIDIDFFKKVNDRYGHKIGDEILKVFSNTIKNSANTNRGFAGRWGGEEIVAYVPINEKDIPGFVRRIDKELLTAINSHYLDPTMHKEIYKKIYKKRYGRNYAEGYEKLILTQVLKVPKFSVGTATIHGKLAEKDIDAAFSELLSISDKRLYESKIDRNTLTFGINGKTINVQIRSTK